MIEIISLSKTYPGGQYPALDDVSAVIENGSFFTLLGPSGCGKTTLLRCLAGLETPDDGEIRVHGRIVFSRSAGIDVPINKRRIGMVFQSYAIWPHMNVFENVAFPLRAQKMSDIAGRVGRALEAVHLQGMADRQATKLSGGQQQRVALARAIVAEPSILLLDEPLSNLDAGLREQMRNELGNLQQRLNLTTVLVTHDQEEALSLSDQIALMRTGRIVDRGAPTTLYDMPRSAFAAEFIGAANLIEAVAGVRDGELTPLRCVLGTLWTSSEVKPGSTTLIIRPAQVSVEPPNRDAPGLNRLEGRIVSRRFLGGATEADVAVETGGQPVTLRVRFSQNFVGEWCSLRIDPSMLRTAEG